MSDVVNMQEALNNHPRLAGKYRPEEIPDVLKISFIGQEYKVVEFTTTKTLNAGELILILAHSLEKVIADSGANKADFASMLNHIANEWRELGNVDD